MKIIELECQIWHTSGENHVARVSDLASFRRNFEYYIARISDLVPFRWHCGNCIAADDIVKIIDLECQIWHTSGKNHIAKVSDLVPCRRNFENCSPGVSDLTLFRRHCEKYYVNTLRTGDADLRFYVPTVQDEWRRFAFLTRWNSVHLQVLLSATPQGGMFPEVSQPQALLGSLMSISWKFHFTKIDSEFVINF